MDFTYFNPLAQDEASFVAGFVARQGTMAFLLQQLRLQRAGQAALHHLIVAPRGFGKTTLLRRIAIAIREEPDLRNRFIALSFREEQHNVISLDVFWRNCLDSLLAAREDEGASPDELDSLEAAVEATPPRQGLSREYQDGEPAWDALDEHCRRLRRRPLLLIDNLDTLLVGLGKHHQWALRRRLQTEDGPILIAAAPRYPDSVRDRQAAFYDFFRIQSLDKLDEREVLACLNNMASRRGDVGRRVLDLLNNDPGRVTALNTLAGGNPRTLIVLYSVLESHMSDSVLSQLDAMLDTFTGWYQARTDELPLQARAVFDALALNWDPMTAAALGQVTGLETSAVSSQLSRLEKSGNVEPVDLSRSGKGRSGYQVSERFFNIWYLMRNGPRRARRRVQCLTLFLQHCFNLLERHELAQALLGERCSDPSYALALAGTVESDIIRMQLLDQAQARSQEADPAGEFAIMIEDLRGNSHQMSRGNDQKRDLTDAEANFGVLETAVTDQDTTTEFDRRMQEAKMLFSKGIELGVLGQAEQAIEVYDDVVARFGTATEIALQKQVAWALVIKGLSLAALERIEQAIEVYDDVVARFGAATEAALQEQVASAMVNKGLSLVALGQTEQAINAYDDVVTRVGGATQTALQEQVASALANKGVGLAYLGQTEQAIDAYDDVVARFGAATEIELQKQVASALVYKGLSLAALGQTEQAINACNDVVARFGNATEADLREQVVRALVNKGADLGALGRSEQAISAYDDVVARFGAATQTVLQEGVARALVNKGARLAALGRTEQAIDACDDVVARFGNATELELREQVARALVNKGARLATLGRTEQAINACDDVVARFGTATELELREQVAKALVNKGGCLATLGRTEEAIDAYDDVVARFSAATETELREQVARALVNRGARLAALGRTEQAIDACDDVVARFGNATETVLQEGVSRALVSKGARLAALGRTEQAIEAYDDVVARFGNATETVLQEGVSRALVSKGARLAALGRTEEAIDTCDDVVARFGTATEIELREQVARALVIKSARLAIVGQTEKAIEACDDVVTRFGAVTETALREYVASALIIKGLTLPALGLSEQAIKAYDDVVARFGAATDAALRKQVLGALVNKGARLAALGRTEEAIDTYDVVVARFGAATELALQEQVASTLIVKGLSLSALGRTEQAINTYDDVVARFGATTESELRDQVIKALESKARALAEIGQYTASEETYRSAIEYRADCVSSYIGLGNMLLDFDGAPTKALEAYEHGLAVAHGADDRAVLNTNLAYVFALHTDNRRKARSCAEKALEDGIGISDAGRRLIEALPIWRDDPGVNWSEVFDGIGLAVISRDPTLWTTYGADLQRLLGFVLAKGQGPEFKRWMDESHYPLEYAPLYHAFVAALEGEDHLLRINVETRSVATTIHAGIARHLKIHEKLGTISRE